MKNKGYKQDSQNLLMSTMSEGGEHIVFENGLDTS